MKTPRISSIFTPRLKHAFSLVEVTISLGIMAFVLTGITGLLSGSCSINREAANDSAFTQITRNVVESLRSESLDTLLNPTQELKYYFAEDGSPLDSSGGAVPQGALYSCVAKAEKDTGTQSADSNGGSNGTVNMVKLGLTIRWPVSASNPATKYIYVQLARY